MRSTRNIRICHLLRIMRVVAPVEWSVGLPFPRNGETPLDEPMIARPEELSFTAWLDSRARVRPPVSGALVPRALAA